MAEVAEHLKMQSLQIPLFVNPADARQAVFGREIHTSHRGLLQVAEVDDHPGVVRADSVVRIRRVWLRWQFWLESRVNLV